MRALMLFLRNLAPGTPRDELARFVAERLRAGLVNRLLRPRLEMVEILKVQDPRTGKPEYHGLVRVLPDCCAGSVLRQLHGRLFRGLRLDARRYVARSSHDRRSAYTDPRLLPFAERRQEARRRPNLEVKTLRPAQATGARGEVFNARPRYRYAWDSRPRRRADQT
jgi:hypothetical protein